MPELDEEMQTAQARPNLYDNVPGASPRPPGPGAATPAPPPKTTPGGTPIGTPGGFSADGFISPRTSKPGPELDKSLKDFDTDQKSALEKSKKHPGSADDLSGWYGSLRPKQKEMADQLQDHFKKKGYSGWFDPKIKGDDLKLRDYLFDQTSAAWQNSMDRKERKKPAADPAAPDSPEKFFGKGKRSELKDDAPAIAMMGGNYMDEGEA